MEVERLFALLHAQLCKWMQRKLHSHCLCPLFQLVFHLTHFPSLSKASPPYAHFFPCLFPCKNLFSLFLETTCLSLHFVIFHCILLFFVPLMILLSPQEKLLFVALLTSSHFFLYVVPQSCAVATALYLCTWIRFILYVHTICAFKCTSVTLDNMSLTRIVN